MGCPRKMLNAINAPHSAAYRSLPRSDAVHPAAIIHGRYTKTMITIWPSEARRKNHELPANAVAVQIAEMRLIPSTRPST